MPTPSPATTTAPDPLVARLVSGGQTGVDRAALDVAVRLGLPYGGWCPAGGWAEDRPVPPGIRADYPGLRETPSADPEERTRANVRDGDATLVLVPDGGASAGDVGSPGTQLTLHFAAATGRPVLVCRLDCRAGVSAGARAGAGVAARPGAHEPGAGVTGVSPHVVARVRDWLRTVAAGRPAGVVLNVAGPRASEWPAGYALAHGLLLAVLGPRTGAGAERGADAGTGAGADASTGADTGAEPGADAGIGAGADADGMMGP